MVFLMIILLLVFGYIVAYAILMMMFVAFACGVVVSFLAYVLTYYGACAWAAIRHRNTPEWRYKRAKFVVNEEKFQTLALVSGIATMGLLIVGFLIYAFTGSVETAFGWAGGIATIIGLIAWDNKNKPRRPGDRVTYGQIKDKHGV